jgi:hypothetical protein
MKSTNKNKLNTLSYVALVLLAVLLFVSKLLPMVGVMIDGTFINILDTVKNILVLIVIGVSAYNFTINRAKWVTMLYWTAVLVFAVGTLLVWFI